MISVPSIVKDNASNGQATEHKPHNTHELEFTDNKSISINPRAIGTVGPNLKEDVGQTLLQIPQPKHFESSYFNLRTSEPVLSTLNIYHPSQAFDIAWLGQF